MHTDTCASPLIQNLPSKLGQLLSANDNCNCCDDFINTNKISQFPGKELNLIYMSNNVHSLVSLNLKRDGKGNHSFTCDSRQSWSA